MKIAVIGLLAFTPQTNKTQKETSQNDGCMAAEKLFLVTCQSHPYRRLHFRYISPSWAPDTVSRMNSQTIHWKATITYTVKPAAHEPPLQAQLLSDWWQQISSVAYSNGSLLLDFQHTIYPSPKGQQLMHWLREAIHMKKGRFLRGCHLSPAQLSPPFHYLCIAWFVSYTN